MAETITFDAAARVPDGPAAAVCCRHCGLPCRAGAVHAGGHDFCCAGCQTVFEILTENGLSHFYQLNERAGVTIRRPTRREQFLFLDEPPVRAKLVDFSDGQVSRVTFTIPSMHCIACVWLLENLFRLKPGIGRSTVHFARKELAVQFTDAQVTLSELVTLLASLGYEPALSLGSLDGAQRTPTDRRLLLQIGVAGFAFGNIMLISICLYHGLDSVSAVRFTPVFGWLSLLLALPVLVYSAADYWRAAGTCVRQRVLTIELPIAAGLVALFAQSVHAVLAHTGAAYFDSLCGLIFFLLIGRWFQQKSYERLSFERDYKSFFPLSVVRLGARGEETVPLSALAVGDRLRLRHGELVPADARIVGGTGLIDYSFVTGEAEPVAKQVNDLVYAGGQQRGGLLELETVKPVSQSYLTSLWNHEAFTKPRARPLDSVLNRYARRFTAAVAVIALGAGLAWWLQGQTPLAWKAFTSILIVACPCALALSAPFALGTAQRVLGRQNIFVKNPQVLETLARVDAVVFDKTGTLTAPGGARVEFTGAALSAGEQAWLAAVTRQSTHPLPVRIAAALERDWPAANVTAFAEKPGCGVAATVDGHAVLLGSARWLGEQGLALPPAATERSASVYLAVDGKYRGAFTMSSPLRAGLTDLVRDLAPQHELVLLSGDSAREQARFQALFGTAAHLHFHQTPQDKLEFIQHRQAEGQTVMMVGDGLNDAGALRQSDIGVAVVENIGAFSPASDIILAAADVARLADVLRFAKAAVRIVWLSIALSAAYNVAGLAIAASGRLSPLVCAVLMPVSSISVVAFACGVTRWAARRAGFGPRSRLTAGAAGAVRGARPDDLAFAPGGAA